MTKSYAQVVKQIETLQQEAEKLRRDEMQGVIDRIREAVRVYGLSAQDLGLAARPGRKPKAAAGKTGAVDGGTPAKGRRRRGAAGKTKAAAVVKFRNDSGGTWGGRGKRPQWLRDALASGKSLQDFAVK